jgi:2-polyprenyl-6-methoxyphenol hydroxylase-like FAD-dependent oxidoreductase
MTGVRSALVIGGGIAGPVAAMALRKAGISATIYEAYGSSADGVGGILTLAPNGLDALRIVGVDEAVAAVGQPMRRMVLDDGRGRPIGEFAALEGLPPSRTLWRTDLYRVLHDHAAAQGIVTEYGKRLVGVDETPDGVTARFADGSTATGDVLIGADGSRSAVRSLIDPAAPGPKHVPLLNFGAWSDFTVPADPGDIHFVFGKRAFLGYWAQEDGRTAWFSNLPCGEPMTAAQAREVSNDEWIRRLREVYADDVPGADLLRHTDPAALLVLGSTEIMPKVPHWHRGRMVLVGDSAHAPSPSSGQGASLAAESAVELALCLRDLPDVPSAFAAYEALRRPRVEKVAARAAKTNNTKALGPVGKKVMGLLMPIAMKTFLNPEKQLGEEQRYRIDWQAQLKTCT